MIFIVIPVYNEEKNLPNLYHELCNFSFEDSVYFVFSDDGSSDATVPLIKSLFSKTNTIILGDGINRGPGYVFNRAFEWVMNESKNTDDIVLTIEADCTSDLSILPNMLSINKLGYNLVLASIYAQGGGFYKTTFSRRLISTLANLLFRFLFNVQVLTMSSFYRIYSVELLNNIKQRYGVLISERGFICMLEILLKSISCNAKVIEVPMILNSNKRIGKSKMKIVKTMIEYFKFFVLFKNRQSPLKNVKDELLV